MLKSLLFGLVVAGLMVCSANAGIIFEDNFNSYAYDNSHLSDQSTVWQGVGTGIVKFVSWHNGQAYFSNGNYGDTVMKLSYVDVDADDYTVSADIYAVSGYVMEYYVTARSSDSQYVAAGVVTDGTNAYARIIDSTGAALGDYWFGGFDGAGVNPVHIDLTVNGSDVSATFASMGLSTTLNTTTTITTGSNAGFGGKYKWNYPLGLFDNFVVAEVPEPATMSLLALGSLALIRRKK